MNRRETDIYKRVVQTRLKNDGYQIKDKLPWCREYYIGSGLSEDEIEEIRRTYFKGFHLEDETEMKIKRKETRKKNGKPLCGGVSKESVNFFNSLISEFSELKDSLFGKNRERWLRDPDNFDKYYFYDLTNLRHKLIIEYDGWEWHPRSRSGEWNSFMKPYQEKQFDNDRRKDFVASHFGFTLLRYRTDFSETERETFYRNLREYLNHD